MSSEEWSAYYSTHTFKMNATIKSGIYILTGSGEMTVNFIHPNNLFGFNARINSTLFSEVPPWANISMYETFDITAKLIDPKGNNYNDVST